MKTALNYYTRFHTSLVSEDMKKQPQENDIFEEKGYHERFDLKDLVDLKLLQNIQEKLAEVTGLAFVTVDFRGEPITERTSFSDFCFARREIEEYKITCCLSDAHGGLEAAIWGKPYIYRCPAGLVDFAVPIVVRGQYLGAVLCGQVRCPDSERFVDIGDFVKSDTKWKSDASFTDKYNQTLSVEYDKIVSTAELVYLVINQLVEKEVVNIIQEELNRKNLHLMKEKKARVELEKELKISELKALKAQINPHFMFNVLNSINNLALVEGAKQTQEMAYLFSNLLRYNLENADHAVYLKDDIENIERYLKVQKIRFGSKLSYTINMDKTLENQKMLPFILQPFVENAVNHGIVPKETSGQINVSAKLHGKDILIRIEDDGLGMSPRKIEKIYHFDQDQYEGSSLGIGIQNTRKRLIQSYGEEYDIHITSRENIGTTVEIKIPQDFNERFI